MSRTRQPTIADVAARAGVSPSAVSFVFNGRSGVSEATRQKVFAAAEALAWRPNSSARSLATKTSEAVGLVLARPARMLGAQPYFMELMAGLEEVLAEHQISLMLRTALGTTEEIAAYEQWARGSNVDGVVVVDLRVDDPRPDVLATLGLPTTYLTSTPMEGVSNVVTDQLPGIDQALDHLVEAGHRRIARIAGPSELANTHLRTDRFRDRLTSLGVEPGPVVHTDFSASRAAAFTADLLARDHRPTAIVYENSVMAVAGVGTIEDVGLRVPGDISILALDDSAYCEVARPAITAVTTDVAAVGRIAAAELLALILEGTRRTRHTPSSTLTVRASTGQAPISS